MNLEYLKTYLEVVRLGSFSEAARKLALSQPAISFQVQRLEQDLGIRLIERGRKPLVPTEAGKRLLRFAGMVEKEREILVQDLERLRGEVVGDLVIIASTIPGEFILPALLGEFKKQHPAVNIRVIVSDSMTVIAGVKNSTQEVGFCGMAPEGQGLDSVRVAEDEIVLIVFPEHPFAGRGEVSFVEVVGEPLIFREQTSGTQRNLESLLTAGGFDASHCRPALTVGTTEAVISAVEARAGIAFVSSLAIRRSLALGLVREVRVKGLRLRRDFYCIYRRERIVSRLLEVFIEFVRARSSLA